jgi:circadian clock protein KaiC
VSFPTSVDEESTQVDGAAWIVQATPTPQPAGVTMSEQAHGHARTGIAGLDDVLRGGLPRARVYLVQGDPGVGKTTLALEFLLEGVAHGETALYITLSETEAEIREVAASHGWSLDGLSLFELSAVEQVGSFATENTVFDPSEIELKETMQTLLERVDRLKPERVVFDSLSEIRVLAQDPLRYRRQILALKHYFSGKASTVLLLDDRHSPGDKQLQSLAHGVIVMEQLAPEYGQDRRRLRVVKLRGLEFRGGYHDFNIERGGLSVFPRLVAAEHQDQFEARPVGSGLAALDRLLGGGLDRGTSTLVTGPAGSGKSILATQFAVATALQGEHAALFTFEESPRTLLARSDALGLDLSGQCKAGRISIQQIDPAEMSAGEFVFRVRREVETQRASLIAIDSLNGFMSAMPRERYLTAQLHELLGYLGQKGVTTIMVLAQGSFFGPTSSPVDVDYLADDVILLRYFEAAGHIRKALSVVKKRSGTHESTIRELTIGPGVQVGAALEQFTGVLTGVPTFTGEPSILT